MSFFTVFDLDRHFETAFYFNASLVKIKYSKMRTQYPQAIALGLALRPHLNKKQENKALII